jgi:hypothetical protein
MLSKLSPKELQDVKECRIGCLRVGLMMDTAKHLEIVECVSTPGTSGPTPSAHTGGQ